MSLEIRLQRVDRIFKPEELVQGHVVITTTSSFSHQGISLKVTGNAKLQLSARSVGLFEAFYNSVKPLELIHFEIPLVIAGKIPAGTTKYPFEFTIRGIENAQLFESYHGVYVSVTYQISGDCVRGMMKKNLHRSQEFIVEVPLKEPMPDVATSFRITPQSLENVRVGAINKIPKFCITGKLNRTNCPINLPFTGEIVIEESVAKLRSIEVQLVRVESVTTEIQNIQIAHGDICRELVIPIYMIFPRLFTCPTMLAQGFKVEFEVNLVVLFEEGYMITENFPITLYR